MRLGAQSREPEQQGGSHASNGVAGTQVVAINRANGDRQIKGTNSDKLAIFDAAEFLSAYGLDTIEFNNVGSSWGQSTITINSLTGGFQEATMTTVAAPTVSVNL